jgi:hypothetical protein
LPKRYARQWCLRTKKTQLCDKTGLEGLSQREPQTAVANVTGIVGVAVRQCLGKESVTECAILFLKVVDARFDAEQRDTPIGTETFNTYWWTVERRLRRRFDRWANKRKKMLFGSKVPDSIFLTQAR